jgi:hypothetical protein
MGREAGDCRLPLHDPLLLLLELQAKAEKAVKGWTLKHIIQ